MPFINSDGIGIYYEDIGSGVPVLFAHEFGGDLKSWTPQLRHISRYFRCIAFNARGYPPSDVPSSQAAYSQKIAGDDMARLMAALDISDAHIVGLSMGSVTALDFALRYESLTRSITLCGCGYGSNATGRAEWLQSNAEMADTIASDLKAVAVNYANGPTRLSFKRKDPIGWQLFLDALLELDPLGASMTLRGIQAKRPSLYKLEDKIRKILMPVMIVVGDEDEPALEPSLFLKQTIPNAALWVFPRTGHAVNNEEADLFNRALLDFLIGVDKGRW
ncbi:MAG: alpha/beta hydrolase [Desulfobacterales bacterium]|nr:alpha/beta hydrolase [Desulfobacterales bacterium]